MCDITDEEFEKIYLHFYNNVNDYLNKDVNESVELALKRARKSHELYNDVVTFIDYELDTYKRIFGFDDELKNFMYVKNVKDVENKIKQLKSDKELLNRILEKQHKVVEFDKDKYCVDFVNMIN